jgi:lipopolysaccharide transport system permease protein
MFAKFTPQKFLKSLELLYLLVCKELKVRYAYSMLGYFWTLLIPMAFIGTYFIAFRIVMRVPMEHYIVFLAANIFPWFWFINGIIQATYSYRSNASLVKKVYISRFVLPTSIVLKEMIHYILVIPILIAIVFFGVKSFYLSWLWLVPMMFILQCIFIIAVANIFAILHVFVRDIEYLVGIMMNVIFFMTPVIYPITMIPDQYKILAYINPFASFIVNWNAIWMRGCIYSYSSFLICIISTVFFGVIGYFIYKRCVDCIGEWL